jgi:mannose-6-phosphate isomerase-like protein (cupin superfamily)
MRSHIDAVESGYSGCRNPPAARYPSAGFGAHRHPCDEIQFIREGRGLWTVNGVEFKGTASQPSEMKILHRSTCL